MASHAAKLQAVTFSEIQLGTPGYEVDLLYLAYLVTLTRQLRAAFA